jgi:23S rRNA pseudouridine1911/1915/1917 synthase
MAQPVRIPTTVLEWLVRKFPEASKQTLKHMVEQRRVLVSGKAVDRLTAAIKPTDKVELLDKPRPPAPARTPVVDWIVYEDADLIVVNKPARVLTSTNPREKRPTLWQMLIDYVGPREKRATVGLIHRLDRDASGLLVFSKNDKAFQSLKKQFFHHTVERCYQALVTNKPQTLDGRRISRVVERADGSVHSTKVTGKGELAVSDYRTLRSKGKLALVEVHLQTGRKHQIRVHLAEMDCPILGDKIYNAEGPEAPRLMLQATHLVLDHPATGKRMTFDAALSPEMQKIVDTLPARAKTPTWSEVAAAGPQIRRKTVPKPPESED